MRQIAISFGDITCIHTWAGLIYLATVIDWCSKKLVGWSIADHMRTEPVQDALKNATDTTVIEPLGVFHSDRGSVYASADYRLLVKDLGMRSSMGRTGVCWDNAMAESFLLSVEERTRLPERLRHQGPSQTRCHHLHRGLLQLPPTSVRTWLSAPERSPLRLHPAGHGSIEVKQIHCPKSPQQTRAPVSPSTPRTQRFRVLRPGRITSLPVR